MIIFELRLMVRWQKLRGDKHQNIVVVYKIRTSFLFYKLEFLPKIITIVCYSRAIG